MENKMTYEELVAETTRLRNKVRAYQFEGTPEGLASKLYEAQRELEAYDYDYKVAVKEDAVQAINDLMEYGDLTHDLDGGDIESVVFDSLCDDDNVTGIQSGSYTLNQREAERNLCHNWQLVQDAIEDGVEIKPDMYPELIDAKLRYYVLQSVVKDAIKESHLSEEWFWGDDEWAQSSYVREYERENPRMRFKTHVWDAYSTRDADAVDETGFGYNLYERYERDHEDGRGGEL